MAQRIFDMENEQDVKDLFDILPEGITWADNMSGKTIFYDNHGALTKFYENNLLKIKWGRHSRIDRPVDKSKWIGCLCAFDDVEINKITQNTVLGILHSILPTKIDKYKMMTGELWEYCRPVKRSEIRFVEDGE